MADRPTPDEIDQMLDDMQHRAVRNAIDLCERNMIGNEPDRHKNGLFGWRGAFGRPNPGEVVAVKVNGEWRRAAAHPDRWRIDGADVPRNDDDEWRLLGLWDEAQ